MAAGTEAGAARAGQVRVGPYTVNRLGFGAMRLTGPGIVGEPERPDEARAVLRRAVELGVNLIDTAHSYGPEVSERLIGETLRPYPDDLVIATKSGLARDEPRRLVLRLPPRGAEARVRAQPGAPRAGRDPPVPAPLGQPGRAVRGVGGRAR